MINKLLHSELSSLRENCKQLIKSLDAFCGKFKNEICREEINNNIKILEKILRQLELHLTLDDTSITSINFYELFQTQFSLGRYKKEVEYYIQNGYGKSPELVTDEETLKKEFTIDHCMKSMSLVPINLASNAMKYMLSGQQAKVVLFKTARRNMITVSNLGPKNKNENMDNLTEEGVRGDNSFSMAGMGLGLSQVKSVIGFHKPILDTSFNIKQDTETKLVVDGVEYADFSVTISFLRTLQEQTKDISTNDFFDSIPIIIIHNMADIVANLFSMARRLLRLPFRYDADLKDDFTSTITRFELNVEQMQETIKLCLYIHNKYSTINMLGNVCAINIGDFFKKEMELLYKHKYMHKSIEMPQISGKSYEIEIYSVIYPIIYGLCNFILSKATSESKIDIEIDKNNITIFSEDIEFKEILYDGKLYKEPEMEPIDHIRSRMYFDVLKDCNIDLTKDETKLTINF